MTKDKARTSGTSAGVILASAMIFCFMLRTSAGNPGDCARGDIKVTIKKISYEGRDKYSCIVSVINDSPKDVRINRFEEHFFIQTEKGWYLLRTRNANDPEAEGFLLPHGTTKEYSARFSISLTLPGIFRTSEGDISLMQRFTLRCSDSSGKESRRTDELLYWLTPRTAKWILREGM